VANQNSNDVTVIDGVTNMATTTVGVGNVPSAVTVNPMTNKIYVANKGDNNVSVIDATNNNAITPVSVGIAPTALAINHVTGKLYVANNGDNSVSVIDTTNNNTIATVTVGSMPVALAVNYVSNKIYVANTGDNNVTIIDAANNNATTTVNVGTGPTAVAVNSLTNKIYVANNGSNNVTVINGADNTTAPPVSVGTNPTALAVNPVTNTIYVANSGSSNVTVINGADNTTAPPVSVGSNPTAIATDPVSNKIYVANNGSASVTSIDGATNFTESINAGTAPHDIAVNPVTNKIYVPNNGSANVTILTEQQVQPIPLTTSITATAGNQFTFTTNSSYGPFAPLVQNVYFQFDTWQGPWLKAAGSAPNFTGGPPTPLLPGLHIIYAYATDGQFADSIQPGGSGFGQSSPIAGAIAALAFLIVPESSSVAVSSSTQPSVFGQPLTFTATVTSFNFGTPSGTVTFTDGATTLGTAALDNNGQATLPISTLALGSHSIAASYSGDASFIGSNSAVFTQTVNQATSSSSVALTAGTNPSSFGQSLTFTATVTPQFTGVPAGTVTFLDKGVTILGPPVTLDGSAHASLTISTLAVGAHSITVVYSGDKNFSSLNVSPALPQVVKAASITNIALSSGTNPSTAGNSLTFTATVGPQSPSVPTGSVTFLDAFDSSMLGGGPVMLVSGQASVTTLSLAAGVHTITAVYSGDSNFISSTSIPLTQVVMATGNHSSTGLTVNGMSSTNLNPVFAKGVLQSANFVISVPGSNDGEFVVLLEGNQQLGPVLALTGTQASWNSQLRVGVHNVQAVYIGNGTLAGSTSTVVVVNRSPRPLPR